MRQLSLIFLITICHWVSYSQSARHKVHVIARSYGDSIVLRWAPGTAIAWEIGNKNGYHVERYLIRKDSLLLENPVRDQLTGKPVKPLPIEQWESIVLTNKYAALAAQALYGKTFQLSTGNTGASITQIYQKVKESDARFSLALFAADFSREVSIASGLRLTDKNVKKGERYLYRVFTTSPNVKIDTAFCYVATDDILELPKPMDVQAHAEKGMAVITWNKNYFSDIYTAYFIERSDDGGKSYHTVNDLPMVNTFSGTDAPERGIFTDSIPQEGKDYYYRVRGVSSFAEQGPPSEAVVVISIPAAAFTPEITEAVPFNNSEVHLKWSYPKEGEASVKEFRIEKGEKASGPYSVVKSGIKSSERTYVDKKPSNNAYYRISALGLNESERRSFPHLVQLIDSIAPAAPVQPIGVADSAGVVKLRWRKNKEHDLNGYRVYRANFANDEYFQVTAGAVKDTVFYDTINSKTLTRTVYYKIVAIDNNFNPSSFSEPVMINRVDRIPPTPPVFVSYEATAEGIFLRWKPSSSEDVKETVLYRRIKGEMIWKPVSTFSSSSSVSTFLDKETISRNIYEYQLRAVDAAGLQSDENNIVVAKRFDDGIRPEVMGVRAAADRKNKKILLSWTYAQSDVSKFQIYRKAADGKLVLFATINGSEKSYEDTALKVNTQYVYSIKAIWSDGGESPMSEKIIVKY